MASFEDSISKHSSMTSEFYFSLPPLLRCSLGLDGRDGVRKMPYLGQSTIFLFSSLLKFFYLSTDYSIPDT